MDPKALVYKHAKFKLREARRLYRDARRSDNTQLDNFFTARAKELEAEANQVLGSIDKWFETL